MKKLALLLLVLALVAIPTTAALAEDEPVEGGTMRWGMVTSPRGMFNPILAEETYCNLINGIVYDGLVAIDRDLEPVPQLAESYEFSEDEKSVTFYLHEGIKFHDGEELTAHDVAFTYEIICHPDYTGVRYPDFQDILGAQEFKDGEADEVEGIEVIDDYTIRFTTEEVYAPLITSFTYGILPKHLLEDIPVAELETAEFNQNPIGAGPFKFSEFRPDQHVVVERFDDYYLEGPYLDYINFQIISDEARPVHLRQGRIDYVTISSEQYPMVEQLDFVDVYEYEALGYDYFCFNLRQERFQDELVRQALWYGYDQQTVVDVIYDGLAIPAYAPMPTASWAYAGDELNDYAYNPDRAIELFEEAGWERGADGIWEKDDMRMEFEFLFSDATRQIEQNMLLFQQNMEDIGVDVDLRPMEFAAAVDRIDAREFDMFALGWNLGVDPDPYTIWHSTSVWNDAGWVNERSDELIEAGRRTTDFEERQEIYAEWQQIVNKEVPNIFNTYDIAIAAANERIRGLDREDPTSQGIIYPLLYNQIWIPADQQ